MNGTFTKPNQHDFVIEKRQKKLLIFIYNWYGNTDCGVFKQGTKLERFIPKHQHTQKKLLNFENWVNGEVSKIGHHFRKKK